MEFTERFKKYTNTELLKIIDNPEGFQQKAVETAKTILSDRHLTEEEIKIAKEEIKIERQEKLNEEEKKRKFEDKLINVGKSILKNANPIQKKTPTTEKTIKIISLVFGGLFLIQLYKNFALISLLFTDISVDWDFSKILYFLLLIIVPAGIFLFCFRNKFGWMLFTIYLTYSAVLEINLAILTMNMDSSLTPAHDSILPQASPKTHAITFIFFALTIWLISRENVRAIYTITKQKMILTISITAIIVGLALKTL